MYKVGDKVKVKHAGTYCDGTINSIAYTSGFFGNLDGSLYYWVDVVVGNRPDCHIFSQEDLDTWNIYKACHCGSRSVGVKDEESDRHSYPYCPLARKL